MSEGIRPEDLDGSVRVSPSKRGSYLVRGLVGAAILASGLIGYSIGSGSREEVWNSGYTAGQVSGRDEMHFECVKDLYELTQEVKWAKERGSFVAVEVDRLDDPSQEELIHLKDMADLNRVAESRLRSLKAEGNN